RSLLDVRVVTQKLLCPLKQNHPAVPNKQPGGSSPGECGRTSSLAGPFQISIRISILEGANISQNSESTQSTFFGESEV
ncbi:hypothetical protein NDU88_006788, partial [Pleurodeles waltl]